MIVLTFIACLAGHCEQQWQAWRTAGIGEARACRMAFDFARSRAHPEATFRDVECKEQERKK
jgi:hypothetical protein